MTSMSKSTTSAKKIVNVQDKRFFVFFCQVICCSFQFMYDLETFEMIIVIVLV